MTSTQIDPIIYQENYIEEPTLVEQETTIASLEDNFVPQATSSKKSLAQANDSFNLVPQTLRLPVKRKMDASIEIIDSD